VKEVIRGGRDVRKASSVAILLGLLFVVGCKRGTVDDDTKDLPKKDEAPLKDEKKDSETKKDGEKKDSETKKDGEKKVEKPKYVQPKPVEPTGKVEKLSSKAYGDEYDDDSGETLKKYASKFVEVEGKVTKLSRNKKGEQVLSLEGGKGMFSLGVECVLRPGYKAWLVALPGQTAKVRGVGPAEDATVGTATLLKCDVLGEGTGDGPPTREASELSDLYSKASGPTKVLFEGKPLIIEGEVRSVGSKNDKDKRSIVVLKLAKPGPPVYLLFNEDSADNERARKLQPGQKVRGLGTFSTALLEEKGEDRETKKEKWFPVEVSVGATEVFLIDPEP
jgi:hypothetical protein